MRLFSYSFFFIYMWQSNCNYSMHFTYIVSKLRIFLDISEDQAQDLKLNSRRWLSYISPNSETFVDFIVFRWENWSLNAYLVFRNYGIQSDIVKHVKVLTCHVQNRPDPKHPIWSLLYGHSCQEWFLKSMPEVNFKHCQVYTLQKKKIRKSMI